MPYPLGELEMLTSTGTAAMKSLINLIIINGAATHTVIYLYLGNSTYRDEKAVLHKTP